LLGEAAADGDLHAGPGALDRGELAEVAEEAAGRVLADGARVDDDDVRTGAQRLTGARLRGHVAGPPEHAGEALGVVDVHLAAHGAHDVGAGRARGGSHRRPSVVGPRRVPTVTSIYMTVITSVVRFATMTQPGTDSMPPPTTEPLVEMRGVNKYF